MSRTLGFLAVLAVCLVSASGESQFDDVNPAISWKTAKDLGDFDFGSNTKPIMFLLTQPWCGACKRLKETMNTEGNAKVQLEKVAEKYVMVHVSGEDDEALSKIDGYSTEDFQPDGGYIPRVVFADPDGSLRTDLKAPREKYAYFYTSADELSKAMDKNFPKFKAASSTQL